MWTKQYIYVIRFTVHLSLIVRNTVPDIKSNNNENSKSEMNIELNETENQIGAFF